MPSHRGIKHWNDDNTNTFEDSEFRYTPVVVRMVKLTNVWLKFYPIIKSKLAFIFCFGEAVSAIYVFYLATEASQNDREGYT